MKKHFRQQIDTLDKTCERFDEAISNRLLEDCMRTIRNGGSIIATALGKNVPLCEKFVGTLNSLSIAAHFMHSNSAVHGDLGVVADGDLVITLSKSGETEETIQLARLLEKIKTTNWLLTCRAGSTAGKILGNELVFEILSEGDPWDKIPNNSSIVFLVFLQALSMELVDRLSIPLEVFKRNHPGGAIGASFKTHGT